MIFHCWYSRHSVYKLCDHALFFHAYRSWTPGESGHIYELTVEHDADFEYFAAFDL